MHTGLILHKPPTKQISGQNMFRRGLWEGSEIKFVHPFVRCNTNRADFTQASGKEISGQNLFRRGL